jgi:hypothetical protein
LHSPETARESHALTGVDSAALPKSIVVDDPPPHMNRNHAKVRLGLETLAGKQPAAVFGVPLGQPPGAGPVARKGDIDNHVTPVTRGRLLFYDRWMNVMLPNRYE